MSLSIVPLESHHLEDAAALVAHRYRALRAQVPDLPPRYGEPDVLLPELGNILGAGPAVAAIENAHLVGFLAGYPIQAFRGEPAVVSPEWGNAAILDDSPRIYRALYARMAAEWVSDTRTVHLVNVLANDHQGLQEWNWLGFGRMSVDAVRDLSPIAGLSTSIAIRRASTADADVILRLEGALVDHLASAPVYWAGGSLHSRDEINRLLADPHHAFWLALSNGRPAGYLLSGPATSDACTIIRDEGTTSLTGAYTLPEARGAGVATALLNRALTWAREAGYVRCAVDFEPMNPIARLFWLRNFSPVCIAVERHIDRRYVRGR